MTASPALLLDVPPAVTWVTIPYPPSTNRYWRNVAGRMLLGAEGRVYKEATGWAARSMPCLDGEVAMAIRLYRPRRVGDLDNRIKPILDALQGVAFTNDSQIIELHVWRNDDKRNPRAEIAVWESA